jgi:hypothetical protein
LQRIGDLLQPHAIEDISPGPAAGGFQRRGILLQAVEANIQQLERRERARLEEQKARLVLEGIAAEAEEAAMALRNAEQSVAEAHERLKQ